MEKNTLENILENLNSDDSRINFLVDVYDTGDKTVFDKIISYSLDPLYRQNTLVDFFVSNNFKFKPVFNEKKVHDIAHVIDSEILNSKNKTSHEFKNAVLTKMYHTFQTPDNYNLSSDFRIINNSLNNLSKNDPLIDIGIEFFSNFINKKSTSEENIFDFHTRQDNAREARTICLDLSHKYGRKEKFDEIFNELLPLTPEYFNLKLLQRYDKYYEAIDLGIKIEKESFGKDAFDILLKISEHTSNYKFNSVVKKSYKIFGERLSDSSSYFMKTAKILGNEKKGLEKIVTFVKKVDESYFTDQIYNNEYIDLVETLKKYNKINEAENFIDKLSFIEENKINHQEKNNSFNEFSAGFDYELLANLYHTIGNQEKTEKFLLEAEKHYNKTDNNLDSFYSNASKISINPDFKFNDMISYENKGDFSKAKKLAEELQDIEHIQLYSTIETLVNKN